VEEDCCRAIGRANERDRECDFCASVHSRRAVNVLDERKRGERDRERERQTSRIPVSGINRKSQ